MEEDGATSLRGQGADEHGGGVPVPRLRAVQRSAAVVEEWEGEVDELAPVKTTLEAKGAAAVVPVHLHSKVTAVGQLELWLMSRDGKWKREGR